MTAEPSTPNGPLSGLTILDLSRVLSGPYCTMLAADMGARVIKIERPDHGDDTRAWGPPFVSGESTYYLSVNRNKESVALNFAHPDGRAILDRLIAKADVVIENFRPGTLDRHGLGYSALAEKYPKLIYVSISGFGQTGPRRDEGGYDAMIQAEGGLMSITGEPNGVPVRLGVAIADIASGMFAFQGLLLALIARGTTGRGQHVDVGLLDSVAALLTYQASRFFGTGEPPPRLGNGHASIAPYDALDANDGALILAVGNDDQWQRLCRVSGFEHLANDSRFDTNDGRVRHYPTLRPMLTDAVRRQPVEHWVTQLRAAGVPAGAVRSIDQVFADPQLSAREMTLVVQHPTIGAMNTLGIPVKLSATPGRVRTAPPLLGEHTTSVLAQDAGVDAAALAKLAEAGVIRSI